MFYKTESLTFTRSNVQNKNNNKYIVCVIKKLTFAVIFNLY